jgi:hypothetical protein
LNKIINKYVKNIIIAKLLNYNLERGEEDEKFFDYFIGFTDLFADDWSSFSLA